MTRMKLFRFKLKLTVQKAGFCGGLILGIASNPLLCIAIRPETPNNPIPKSRLFTLIYFLPRRAK